MTNIRVISLVGRVEATARRTRAYCPDLCFAGSTRLYVVPLVGAGGNGSPLTEVTSEPLPPPRSDLLIQTGPRHGLTGFQSISLSHCFLTSFPL